MTDTDHSGTDPRPPLEEFIRLTSEPGCSWGMADSDVVEICEYALRLESRLSAIRKETIEECRRAMCMGCRADMPMSDDGLWHDRDGYSMPCHAAAIRALAGEK